MDDILDIFGFEASFLIFQNKPHCQSFLTLLLLKNGNYKKYNRSIIDDSVVFPLLGFLSMSVPIILNFQQCDASLEVFSSFLFLSLSLFHCFLIKKQPSNSTDINYENIGYFKVLVDYIFGPGGNFVYEFDPVLVNFCWKSYCQTFSLVLGIQHTHYSCIICIFN
jgi:hypothetical protein